MKFRKKNVKKVAWMCGAIIFLIAVHMATVYLFAVHRFTVSYDGEALTEKAEQEIEHFVQDSALYKDQVQKIIASLKSAFPFIKHVTCSYVPYRMHIAMTVYPLLARIGDDSVLTQNNVCVAGEYYNASLQLDLPVLHAVDIQQGKIDPGLFAYLSCLDHDLIKRAQIYCRSEHEVIFDLFEKPMRLISNYKNKPTERMVDYCMRIAKDKGDDGATKPRFTADIRFADRIIVAGLRNGGIIA